MARDVICRFRLTGTLVAKTPLHVGGHGDDVDTDLRWHATGGASCTSPAPASPARYGSGASEPSAMTP
jgi:hypothetical protein